MKEWVSDSPASTRRIGAELATLLAANGAVLIVGELGSGKTVLVQGLASALEIDPAEVQSPTYTLVREHGEGPRLVHVDLHRLAPEEVEALGLDEILAGPGVKAIEWPERIPFEVRGAVRCELERIGAHRRRIRCAPTEAGTGWGEATTRSMADSRGEDS